MNHTLENLTITNSLTVRHPNAPFGLKILATETGAGIWIGDKTFVAMHAIEGQVCLAVGKTDQPGGHAFAISVDEDGNPSLQLCQPGKEPIFLSGETLRDMFSR